MTRLHVPFIKRNDYVTFPPSVNYSFWFSDKIEDWTGESKKRRNRNYAKEYATKYNKRLNTKTNETL